MTTLKPTLTYINRGGGNSCIIRRDIMEEENITYISIQPTLKLYSERELFLTDKSLSGKVIKSKNNPINFIHNSLKGRLYAEMFFICKCIPKVELKNSLIVYVSTASIKHLNYLATLFEKLEFHIYCISENEQIKNLNNVKIYKYNFNTNITIVNPEHKTIYFISNARNTKYKSKSAESLTKDVIENNIIILDTDMAKQRELAKEIGAKYGLFLFRPYTREELKVATESNVMKESFEYMKGVIYSSPYSKPKSNTLHMIAKISNNVNELYYHEDIYSRMNI